MKKDYKMNNNEIPFELNFSLVDSINIDEMLDVCLLEGIDLHPEYDDDGKIKISVEHNPTHNSGINTSTTDNPTSFKLNVPKIKTLPTSINVWSIFQRTKLESPTKVASSDGNPLIYAFKHEKNYVFKSAYDKIEIQKMMDQILDKFVDSWFASINNDVATIICPSGNTLNDFFAKAFKKIAENHGHHVKLYDDVLTKASIEDVKYHVFDDPNSELNRWLFSLNDFKAEDIKRKLNKSFVKMENEHKGLFSYHFIEDPLIRNMIGKSMSIHLESHANIDGKSVLLLDDTISRGKTLQEAYQLVCSSYNPKDVTALTLFSPLSK